MKTKRTPLHYEALDVVVYEERRPPAEPVLWPSLGEYRVYDEVLYYIMTHDEARNSRYNAAVARHAPGRVALDIGTGQDLNWALACLKAGARKVYAIEEMDSTFAAAQERVRSLGIQDRLTLLHGTAGSIELPERVDLCVSEIIGTVGSSEGVLPVLQDARRRFMAPGGVMIPERCVTRIAGVQLPAAFHDAPAFEKHHVGYVKRIFSNVGHPFDVKLCLQGADASYLLSTSDLFEDLDFTGDLDVQSTRSVTLEVTKPGRLDGFLLWIELWCVTGQTPIDSLGERTNWPPVFFPVFYPGITVQPGDRVAMTCEVRSPDHGVCPDYRVHGELRRAGSVTPFDHRADHHGRAFRAHPFYERLFPR